MSETDAPELDLTIAPQDLEELLRRIPNEILVWTREQAARLIELQHAKNHLKVVEAKANIDIRNNPLAYGQQKVTEDAVKNIVTIQPTVIEAQSKVVELEGRLASARAIVESLETKRSSLKYLAELTVAGYLGSTNVSVKQPKGVRNDAS